jgi:indole-3-glycerol phosphate synthase
VSTYLDHILDWHRQRAAADGRSVEDLIEAASRADPTRGFRRALLEAPGLAVIAEVKRRSPSKGVLAAELDPSALARAYEHGGASCLSVLTDEQFFAGSADDLRAARAATALPVLRKDFTVSERDVCDARLMGADCVLLIVAALEPAHVTRLHALASEVGLDALVEVHDEAELDVAVAAGATLVGVNQRDLVSFDVDPERARRMAGAIPPGVVKVAESGIANAVDAGALAGAGYDAILVGEALVTAPDPIHMIHELKGA